MGVPGLWRILDLASQPLDLEKCSGLRIAIDINSHANRLAHSQSASNWIYILARDFFRILHFDIRVVVVFMGRRPLEKIYSTALGDETEDSSYYRVRSLILRSNKHSPNRESKPDSKPEKSEPLIIPTTKFPPRNRVLSHLEEAESINDISKRQIDSISKTKALPTVQKIHHSNFSSNYIFFEQNSQPKAQKTTDNDNKAQEELKIPEPQDQSSSNFYSSLFDDIKDIISEDDPSSEGSIPPEKQQEQENPIDTLPISLLPDDNSYLPPIENYITATHIRLIEKLCDILGIPYIQAPEEASAECARLEREGIVDAVASDDNNSVLFGSKWLIRGLFTRPQSITIETLEKVGITNDRMIMIAMMIDGDYNMDIRKRLFTVGPVRGMEILSLFPDEKDGLFQFKKWWIKVVKNKEKEDDTQLRRLAKMKWLKKLIMPEKFPPEELLNAFKKPVVGEEKPVVGPPKFDKDEVTNFIRQSSSMSEERIREHTNNFAKRIQSLAGNGNRQIFTYCINKMKENPTFIEFIDRIRKYDRLHKNSEDGKKSGNENDEDDDEWDTVSDTGSDSNNNGQNQGQNSEEENEDDSIEEGDNDNDDKDSIEEGEKEEDKDSIEEGDDKDSIKEDDDEDKDSIEEGD